jgi:hypothetical protein
MPWPSRRLTENEYRGAPSRRLAELAADFTAMLPQDARDARLHFSWEEVPPEIGGT